MLDTILLEKFTKLFTSEGMGGNMTEEALQRAARSVSTLESLCLQFDKCSGVPARTHSHSTLSDIQDVDKVRTTVVNRQLLSIVPGRKHRSYSRIKSNPLSSWDMRNTMEWIQKKKVDFLKFRGAVKESGDDDIIDEQLDTDHSSDESDYDPY